MVTFPPYCMANDVREATDPTGEFEDVTESEDLEPFLEEEAVNGFTPRPIFFPREDLATIESRSDRHVELLNKDAEDVMEEITLETGEADSEDVVEGFAHAVGENVASVLRVLTRRLPVPAAKRNV